MTLYLNCIIISAPASKDGDAMEVENDNILNASDNDTTSLWCHHILGGIFPKLDWCVNFFQSISCVFQGENDGFDRS